MMISEAVSGDIIQLPDTSEYLYSRIRYCQCGLRMTLTYAPMGSRAEIITYVESNSWSGPSHLRIVCSQTINN